MAIAISYVLWSNTKISDNFRKSLFNRSEYLSEESIRIKCEENDQELAIQLALNALPDGKNEMPYNPHAQFALSTALDVIDTSYSGIHYYKGVKGENFLEVNSSDDGIWLAGVSSHSGLYYQFLYLWNTKNNKLVAKHNLGNDYMVEKMFFSKEYLWITSYQGIKIYALSNGRLIKEIKPASDVLGDIYNGMNITTTFLNGNKFYSFLGDKINVYDIDSLQVISTIKFEKNLKNHSIKEINVSPDDRYFAVIYSSSKDTGYSENLAVMDMKSQEFLFDKEFFEEHTIITEICFGHERIFLSRSSQFEEDDETEIPGYDSYPHTQLKNTVLCFDCPSGKKIWEKQISNKQQKLGAFNSFRIQFLHMKISNSDKYKDLVIALDDNVVFFLDPVSGEIMQKEELPYNHYYMYTFNTYEDTQEISLFEDEKQVLLNLCFDKNDSSTSFKTISIRRPGLTSINTYIEKDWFFACFGDEIIHYKKVGKGFDFVMLDKESFYGEIIDRFSFDNYVALIVKNGSAESEQSTVFELRIYDLKEGKLFDVVNLDGDHSLDFIGVAENKYIIIDNKDENGIFYKYDISTKKLDEINIADKFKGKYGVLQSVKMVNNDLILLLDKNSITGNRLYPVIYQIAEDTIKKYPKKVSVELSFYADNVFLNDDGTKAYIETNDGTKIILDLKTGESFQLTDVFGEKSNYRDWNDHQIGLYDGNKLLVYDIDKNSKVIEIENSDIASFTLTEEYLYYLDLNGSINRVSLDTGKRESSFLKKYAKYKEINLSLLEGHYENCWYFDDNTIRILHGSVHGITMLEIDKDTLELIGQHNNVVAYNEESNRYCADMDYDTRTQEIALFNCYDLNALIEKGKMFVNNKELGDREKMRYGIE